MKDGRAVAVVPRHAPEGSYYRRRPKRNEGIISRNDVTRRNRRRIPRRGRVDFHRLARERLSSALAETARSNATGWTIAALFALVYVGVAVDAVNQFS